MTPGRQVQLLGGILIMMVALALPMRAAATEYTEASGWRQVEDFFIPLPPGTNEGSIEVTITADRPIDLVAPDPAFVRRDPFTFFTVFPWDWTAPREVGFVDDLGDTTYLQVAPGPPRPFDPTDHQIPVISVTTASTGLWDPETGIYVVGNYTNFDQRGGDWEREAVFRYFEPGQGLVVEEPVGLRIHGGFSRYYHQKGLRIYFDDYGTSDQVEHVFFPAGPSSFRRLICRPNRFDSVAINTNIAEGLMGDLGHAYSRHRFAALYLNEEYWGAYNLRERLDDEFFEHTWELAEKGDWNFIKDGDLEEGTDEGWWTFLSSFGSVADPTDPAWFDSVRDAMDLSSYIDWQLINIFMVPTDNGFTWNLALYQPGDHPWRFVMWDEDLIMNSADVGTDMFRFFTAQGADEWAALQPPSDNRSWTPEQQEWLTMFRTLLGNPDFRVLFKSRYDYLVSGELDPDALVARLDALVASQMPEIPGQADRWEGFQVDWYETYAASTRQWIRDRHQYFTAQAEEFFTSWPAPEWSRTYEGLVINEIMPLNESTATDESGDFDGWVELFNWGNETLNLTGVQLFTDSGGTPWWELPAAMIRPGEYLLVWLDGQEAEGPLHAPVNMPAENNRIRLAAPAAEGGWSIDTAEFGLVRPDVSVGWALDGASVWGTLAGPTPGAPNSGADVNPEQVPSAVVLQDNYPNPFNSETNIIFGLPSAQNVRIRVFDARGGLVATLLDGPMAEGYHPVQWNGTDAAGRFVASGVFYARLESESGNLTNSMTLVR